MSTLIGEYLSANTFVRYYIFTSPWKQKKIKSKLRKRFSSKFTGIEEAQWWLFSARTSPGTLLHKNQDLLLFSAGLRLSFSFQFAGQNGLPLHSIWVLTLISFTEEAIIILHVIKHMLKTYSGVNLHPRELHLPFLQWHSIQWNATSVSWLHGDVDIFCTDTNHSCCIFDKLHPSLLQNSIKPMIQWAPAGCMGGDFEAINGDSKGKHSAKCQLWWLRCHNITSGGRPK